jgi:hypothetical protein
MNSLAQVVEQIKAEITVDSNGKGKASIRATARLAGVSDMALRKSFDVSANLKPGKLAKMLTEQGFDMRTFSDEGIPDIAVAFIVKYYAYLAGERCTDLAKQVDMSFTGIGVRSWMQDVAGYRKQSEQSSISQLPADIRLGNLAATLQSLNDLVGYDFKEPRLNQYTKDLIGDIIVSHAQNRLLPASHPKYLGVAERAEQLGYSVSLVTKNRSQLGKYVKAFGLPSVKEQRLCNGTMRDINLYELTNELDNAIKEFMDAKVLSA